MKHWSRCKDEVLTLSGAALRQPRARIHLFQDAVSRLRTLPSGQADDARLFDQTAIVDTEIWKALFDFQKDGVKGAIHKINDAQRLHPGRQRRAWVKPISALAVIKYFELRNQRVLVLCPKKLRDNWTVYLAQQQQRAEPVPERPLRLHRAFPHRSVPGKRQGRWH